ncbi:hypothetical protein [Variovorax sp. JS1663]|uniref:hypothetical protein n=1 Tax=Variovorax sp. JS1663 TaxID=1851577 RepID=UPI000B348D55|nr:hypothetical protein [Variovorax sp. JS1663]OUM00554.1 hypothetical protein A8M77_21035 [Variovorax sp. JS1663]
MSSLIDPTNPARWADGSKRSIDNGFVVGITGEPIDWSQFQVNAGRAAKLAKNHYSPEIESREAGQRSMHKRAALVRSKI